MEQVPVTALLTHPGAGFKGLEDYCLYGNPDNKLFGFPANTSYTASAGEDELEMADTSIVFYCKDCNAMFFAAVNRPTVLKDCVQDIKEYLQAGHKMAEVSHDEVRGNFSACKCKPDEESMQLALALGVAV